MRKSHNINIFDELMQIVENNPEALTEFKVDRLRISLAMSLKKAREFSGKTQRQIAESLGVQQSRVSKLESCNNDHTFESLAKYIFALGADITLSMALDGAVPMVLASSKNWSNSRARKYQVGHLPEFIHLSEDTRNTGKEIWNIPTSKQTNKSECLDCYVA